MGRRCMAGRSAYELGRTAASAGSSKKGPALHLCVGTYRNAFLRTAAVPSIPGIRDTFDTIVSECLPSDTSRPLLSRF